MEICSVESHRSVRAPAASVAPTAAPPVAPSRGFRWGWRSCLAGPRRRETWRSLATAVQARYGLRYNGIAVGRLVINSNTATAKTYSLSGSAKVSVLFGAFNWSGSSSVSGAVEGGAPAPASYGFEWRQNKKNGTVNIGFKDRIAAPISPSSRRRASPRRVVPLTQAHMAGALDPMSAILMLTKADNRPPCDRRVGIFDGKQRYDVLLTPKRSTRLPFRPAAARRRPAMSAGSCTNRLQATGITTTPGLMHRTATPRWCCAAFRARKC